MNLGFKPRFVPRVRSGEKRHTVRAGKRWRAGMRGDLWENMRGPKNSNRPQTLIFRAPIVRVEDFLSERSDPAKTSPPFFRIRIDYKWLEPDELEAFARADGFSDSADMVEWLNSEKRPLTLDGQVIHWGFDNRSTCCWPSCDCIQACPTAKRVDRARELFNIYAITAGISTAWERLTVTEQTAWSDLADHVDQDDTPELPECERCHTVLACPTCDASDFNDEE